MDEEKVKCSSRVEEAGTVAETAAEDEETGKCIYQMVKRTKINWRKDALERS